jgi:hypothetical protein
MQFLIELKACRNGKLEVAVELLNNNADIESKDNQQRTPLTYGNFQHIYKNLNE